MPARTGAQYLDGTTDVTRTVIIGQPTDEELWHLFADSDIVACPSFHEGLCVPAIEAYIAGCRVVSTTESGGPLAVRSWCFCSGSPSAG